MVSKRFAVLVVMLGFCTAGYAAMTLDGVISDLNVVASDPVGTAGEGGAYGGNPCMDLKDLAVKEEGGVIQIGMTMNVDLSVTSWGKYTVLIETDNGGPGSTTHGWGRAMGADGVNFKPQYCIASWVDGGGGATMYHWNGSAWQDMSADCQVAISANGNGGLGGVEWRVTRAKLGNPTTIKLIGASTGGGGGDNAQDAIPSGNGNASDWGSFSVLSVPTGSVSVPVGLSSFDLD